VNKRYANKMITGKVESMERLPNTPAGGPRYEVVILSERSMWNKRVPVVFVLRTAGNCAESYGWSPHAIEGKNATVWTNGRGTIDAIVAPSRVDAGLVLPTRR
jgi:hypothetical protein